MIKIIGNYYYICSKNSSYVMYKNECGHLIHLYYGKRINETEIESLVETNVNGIGTNIVYTEENSGEMMETNFVEVSTFGKGDTRSSSIVLENSDKSRTTDLVVEDVLIGKPFVYKDMPQSKYTDDVESLIVVLRDKENSINVKLAYNVFYEEDVISRQMIIENDSKEDIKVIKAMGLNLDMKNDNYKLKSFHGHWGNEMNQYDQDLIIGKYSQGSICGVSSNRCNPFFMVYKNGCNEDSGKCYGFNMIYSGNHEEMIECDSLGNIRIMQGINPFNFEWKLKGKEVFEVPEEIMSFSNNGFNDLSHHFHEFIKKHIVLKEFRSFPRLVLNNSWEACYFNFTEAKLLNMAKCAKRLGVELFVLDDGWFKGRNNDTTSLGDWIEDKNKLPHGLKGLGDKIRKLGLEFGVWVEPEMINEKSDLYNKHPEWVIKINNKPHSLGRHQMILDLSNDDVVNYLFNCLDYVISESKCCYLKWDMNRIFSDYYSNTLDKDLMLELNHRYYIGLYRLLKTINDKYPKLLIEGCASGGNRFDLGILSYCPQIWASDDTDPFYRMNAEYNYSYGYPLSTLGCHVASSPCLTTLRRSDIDTRFNVSYFGAFGYEIDLREENNQTKKRIIEQINFYKSIRDKIIDCDYYRLRRTDNKISFEVLSKDKSLALITDMMYMYKPIHASDRINVYGMDDNKTYNVYTDDKLIGVKRLGGAVNYISPIHIKDGGILQGIIDRVYKFKDKGLNLDTNGSILNGNGLIINESFAGSGFNNNLRIMLDLDSRLYVIEEKQ